MFRKTGLLTFGFVGALLLSQFPEFFQQYTQRLGGRLDEINAQVEALERRAAEGGKDRQAYLRRFLEDPDPDVKREGRHFVSLLQRQLALRQAQTALAGADRWWRAYPFITTFDWEIAKPTLRLYRPAVPITVEAGIYAGGGFGLGSLIFWLLFGVGRRRADRG